MQCAPSRKHRQHTACLVPQELESLNKPMNFREVKRMFPSAFRPNAPSTWSNKPNTWLSNVDIDSVLFQYEEADESFAFMGTFPVDFSTAKVQNGTCMFNNMCSFAVAQLPPNKTKFAIVINTDPHNKGGKHWIALFCRKHEGIYFFDSYGRKPPRLVQNFMNKVSQEMRTSNPNFECKHNTRQIQVDNSECGVFCVLFVVRMMDERLTFERVCNTMERDDDIQKFRRVMWNPPEA